MSGLEFLDQYTLLVTAYSSKVLKYDINGTYLGMFAPNNYPCYGLLRVDDETIAVSSFAGIFFYDFDGGLSPKYEIMRANAPVDMTLVGKNLLVYVAENGDSRYNTVLKSCLDRGCEEEIVASLPVSDEPHLVGITAIPETDDVLVVSRSYSRIFKCSTLVTGVNLVDDCQMWASDDTMETDRGVLEINHDP